MEIICIYLECDRKEDCDGCDGCECMNNMCMCPDPKIFQYLSQTKGTCVCPKGFKEDGAGGCKPRSSV